MKTDITELTVEQFLADHGENEHVSEFSHEAVGQILKQFKTIHQTLSERKDEKRLNQLNWVELFMDAEEFNSKGVLYTLSHEVLYNVDDLIALARTFNLDDHPNANLWLNDMSAELSNNELYELLANDLKKIDGFVDGAAKIIGEKNGMLKLDNGNYLGLGSTLYHLEGEMPS